MNHPEVLNDLDAVHTLFSMLLHDKIFAELAYPLYSSLYISLRRGHDGLIEQQLESYIMEGLNE